MTRKDKILKSWRLEITYGWRTRIYNQIDPQRSWIKNDIDHLESWRILVQECFNWNFQKDGLFITYLIRTSWHDVWSQSSRVNMRNQYHHQPLSMRKKNMKLKKLESTENRVKEYNISCIGKVIEINMTNELWNQGCFIQKRQLKTIGQGVRVETYKERG